MKKMVAKLDRSMAQEDELEKIEDSHPLVSLTDLFDCPVAEDSEELLIKLQNANVHAVSRTITQKLFGRNPSYIRTDNLRVASLIRLLKRYGNLEVIYAYSFYDSYPGGFLLRLTSESPRPSDPGSVHQNTIFIGISEISELGPEDYPQFKEDVIFGEIPYADDCVFYFHPANQAAYDIANKAKSLCEVEFSETETYVEMIISTAQGLTTQKVKFDMDYQSDLDLHYGDGFGEFHNRLVDRIASRDKGIVMFHGPPGTGKTHYIRRLLPDLNEAGKRVILIPKHVLGALESPSFNHFMLRNFVGEKIVFVIEDSESIISKRTANGAGRSELVSTLLNITDGLLNDIFSIQVVLTFNTDLKSIDDALLRKGRLIAKYEFGEIKYAVAQRLARHLGAEITERKESYTLAEIYALSEAEEDDILINQNLSKIGPAIGF